MRACAKPPRLGFRPVAAPPQPLLFALSRGSKAIDAHRELGANPLQSGRDSGRLQAGLPVGLEFMRCASRPSQTRKTGTGCGPLPAVVIAFALVVGAMSPVQAQNLLPVVTPTPT